MRSYDAQLAELRMAVSTLTQSTLGQDGTLASGQPNNSVEGMVFHAAKVHTELDRLAGLYEAAVGRVAVAEATIQGLAERLAALSAPRPAPEDIGHAATLPPLAASPSACAVGNTDGISGSLNTRFAALVSAGRESIANIGASAQTLFENLAEEYERTALERDSLLNLRDELMRLRQDLARPGGITKAATQVRASNYPAFPKAVLETEAPLCISIVDVGAQNLRSEDHIYAPLQRAGAAKIIGFEPLIDEAEARNRTEPNILLLNHIVGIGGPATFHVARFNPTSSLLEPNMAFLSKFVALPQMCETLTTQTVRTTRLDDIGEIAGCDFLKIDVQGGELDVLKGAVRILREVVTVHCEVEFAPIYKEQPLFADVDSTLRAVDFELIDFINAGYSSYADLPRPLSQSRLLWAEAVYFRSPEHLAALSSAKLLTAAFIAHVNYGMYDLAAHYLAYYDKMTGHSTCKAYAHYLEDVQQYADAKSVETADTAPVRV